MNKKNRYIVVSICIIIITLLVTIYSTYTYSIGESNDTNENYLILNELENVMITPEQLRLDTYSGMIERVSNKDQMETYASVVPIDKDITLPDQYTLNIVPNNRRQIGPTCWAFSSINAIEATIANTGLDSDFGKSQRINPYHMIHALNQKVGRTKNPYGYRDEENESGGTPFNALIYLTNGIGFTTSNSYFYNQSNSNSNNYSQGSLSLDTITNSSDPKYQVKSIQIVPGINIDTLDDIGEENFPDNKYVNEKIDDIKRLINEGIGVTITSRSTQRDDVNPCYKESNHASYCPSELIDMVGAHMTLIVGWDDNYSKNNFKKTIGNIVNNGPAADGAWVIRNSYSYDGYYYISYYDYTTLYNSNIAVTSVGTKDFDNLYQYNPSGCDSEYNCFEIDNIDSSIVNIYTKKTNQIEQVKSISFYADRINSDNRVKIYLKSGNISSGDLSSLFSNENYLGEVNIPANGFYTYDLDSTQDVKITTSKFYVGLKPTHEGTLKIQGKSNTLMSNQEVGIKEGISYYYNGSRFSDLANYQIPSTAFVKVYTQTTNEISESEQVNYTVKYYLEKLDGTYELKDTKTYTGIIGDKAILENYDGFIKPTAINLTETTTLVEYKYARKSYTLTLAKTKGIGDVSGGGSYKHGQKVTINAIVNNGYTWSRWMVGENEITTKKYTLTMPMNNVIYTAVASQNNSSNIKATDVSITNCPTSPIKLGETIELNANVTPSNATNKDVVWTVPSFDVITITNNGRIKAVGSGTATVSVITVEDGYKDKCKIIVSDEIKEENVSSSKKTVSIELDQTKISIIEGDEYKLKATVTGSTKNILWSSSNEEIATIENGLVKAINVGKAKITAKIEGTNKFAEAEVTVITDKEMGVKFASNQLDIYLNREKEIKIITTPTNMVIEKIEYNLEKENLAMITNNTITGLKIGSTKLTVTVNGKYKASTIVYIHDEPIKINISGYSINLEEDKYEYELEIKNEKSLNITSNKDIDIKGNEKLKNGSIIRIINKESSEEYQIKIIKKSNYTYIFIAIISILLIVNVIRLIIKHKKK